MSNPVLFIPFQQPIVSTDAGEPNCPQPVGFAGVGKLTGHKRRLFEAALCVYYESELLHFNHELLHFNENLEHIYCHIPPEMSLALVAELAIGLLVPNQPLPVDTVLNHAVYLHLMWDCVLEGIRSEIDLTPLTEEEEQEERDRMSEYAKNFKFKTPKEDDAAAIKLQEYYATEIQQKKDNKKREKKLRKKFKKEKGTNDDDSVLASLQDAANAVERSSKERGSSTSSTKNHCNILQAKKQADLAANPSLFFQYSLPMNQSPIHESNVTEHPSDFQYRSLLRNVLIFETGIGSMPHGVFIPSLDEKHLSCWDFMFPLWLMFDARINDKLLINLPAKSKLLVMESVPDDDGGLTQLKRIELMNRELAQVQPSFEQSWTPGRGLFALRALQTFCGVQNKYGHDILCYEIFHTHKMARGITYKEHVDELASFVASPVFETLDWQKQEKIETLRKQHTGSIWIDTFWLMLEEHHGSDVMQQVMNGGANDNGNRNSEASGSASVSSGRTSASGAGGSGVGAMPGGLDGFGGMNPNNMAQDMMQSPLFQQGVANLAANPELFQQTVQNNPMLQQIMASNPQLQQVLRHPAMLQQSLQMMQQMSNNNLEKHPGSGVSSSGVSSSGVSSSGVSSINNLNAVYDALQRSTFESDLEYAVNGFYGVDNEFEGELLMDAVFGDPKDKRMQRTANGLKVYVCANCNESFAKSDNTRNLCSGCKLVRYCSRDCQRSHWSVGADGEKGHKRYCQLMKDAAAAVE